MPPYCPSEAEKPRRRVGIADRKVFARPESFCACLQNWPKKQVKRHKIPNSLESFWTEWKVLGQCGLFLDSLESFWTVWEVFGKSGKFPDSLKSFLIVLYFFGQVSDSFNHLRTFVYVVKTIYALLAHMSWTKFTHFVRKVFARQSLPTGKLRLFRALGEIRWIREKPIHQVSRGNKWVKWIRWNK